MYTFNDKPFDVNAHCPYNEITQHKEVTIASKQHTAVDFKGDLLAGGDSVILTRPHCVEIVVGVITRIAKHKVHVAYRTHYGAFTSSILVDHSTVVKNNHFMLTDQRQ